MGHDQNEIRSENRLYCVEDSGMTAKLEPDVISGVGLGKIFGSRWNLLILTILVDNHGLRHITDESVQLCLELLNLFHVQDIAKKAVASCAIILRIGIRFIHWFFKKGELRDFSRGATPWIYRLA
tara:strand:- start:47 stop:421 length:375 start_codon:yes stop_codon:yes gene_type:complete